MTTISPPDLAVDLPSDPRNLPSQVEPTTAREARMLIVMLAACDPCGYVEDGAAPDHYAGISLDVLRRLHRGDDAGELLAAFPADVLVAGAMRFTSAALDWWKTTSSLDARALRGAAEAFSA